MPQQWHIGKIRILLEAVSQEKQHWLPNKEKFPGLGYDRKVLSKITYVYANPETKQKGLRSRLPQPTEHNLSEVKCKSTSKISMPSRWGRQKSLNGAEMASCQVALCLAIFMPVIPTSVSMR